MSSESLQEAVARNSTWINSVITNSKLSSQLTELLSITSLDQKVIIQEGTLDAKYANPKTLRGYKGDWEADTNNPVLSNSSGVIGDIYKVSIGGNIDIGSGSVNYVAGDLIYLSENNWIKISPNQISDIAGLQLALDSLAGALIPQGNWNANINDPDIATGASTGQFWIVSLAGSTNVGGITDWELNDWAVKTETGWAKIDNSDKVISVAGRVGVVTLGITDISGLTTSLAEAVKLTGDQTVAGIKSFTSDFKVADKVISTGDVLSLQTGNGFGGSLILNDAADTLVSSFDLLQVSSFLTSTGMTSNFNNSALRVLAPTPVNNTGLSSLSLATSDASSYGVSLNAWRFGTSGQPKFVLKMHNNSATGLDALIVDTSGNSVFAGTLAASNLSGTNTGDQDLSSYALLTDITGNNSGTNTGDQSLSISGQVLSISGTNSVTLPTQSTSNFVTLDTTQTISGAKTFSASTTIDGGVGVNTLGGTLIVKQKGNSANDGIAITSAAAASHRIWKASDGKFHFGSSSQTTAFTQLLDGSIGIGTTSPDTNLEVSSATGGVLRLTSSDTSINPTESIGRVEFKSNDASTGGNNVMGYMDCEAINFGTTYALRFGTGNGGAATTKVSILHDGKVGIGTDNPPHELTIQGSNNPNLELRNTNYSNGGFVLNRSNYGQQWKWWAQSSLMYFGYSTDEINYTNHLAINANGNVGIGSTNPQAQLNVVAGNTVRTWTPTSGTSAIFESSNSSRAFVSIVGANQSELLFGDAGSQFSGRVRFNHSDNKLSLWSGTERMSILNNGYVGINDSTPAYQLDVNGTIRATGNIIAYSDIRVKENVKTIDSALDKVTKLRGVEYNKIGEDSKSIGVIAQEVEKVVPEVVETDEKGMKAVAYGNISGLLIEAIKELKLEIEELKNNKCKCNI